MMSSNPYQSMKESNTCASAKWFRRFEVVTFIIIYPSSEISQYKFAMR